MTSVIMLDPGHGGSDPGARGHDIVEADYALELARAVLKCGVAGATFALTRSAGPRVPNSERGRLAASRGATLIISLHVNAAPAHTTPRTMLFPRGAAGDAAATILRRELQTAVPPRRTQIVYDLAGYPRVESLLRALGPTPTLLVETGFCSDQDDADWLGGNGFSILGGAIVTTVERLVRDGGLLCRTR